MRVPAADPAVAVDGLVMRYGDKVAVDGLSLTVERQTITAVLGPNGAGKTTTLETCEGYRQPQQGTVRVLGLDPVRDRRGLLPRIGVMLQDGGAWSGVRAMEMLRHIARLHAHPLDVDLLAERLGLGDCGSTPYRRLSRRPAAAPRPGDGAGGAPRDRLRRRADGRHGPAGPARHLGAARGAARRRRDRRAHHPLHGRGRAARRPDPHHRPRPADRHRHAARAHPRQRRRRPATIRLVVTRPFPPGAPESLRRALGDRTEVTQLDEVSLLVTGPADATTLAKVSGWCEEHGVLPESLTLGQRNLEDVFLQLTGRELSA